MRAPSGELTEYRYDEDGLLFAMERGGARYSIATDQVGTPRVVTDATGAIVKALDVRQLRRPAVGLGARVLPAVRLRRRPEPTR